MLCACVSPCKPLVAVASRTGPWLLKGQHPTPPPAGPAPPAVLTNLTPPHLQQLRHHRLRQLQPTQLLAAICRAEKTAAGEYHAVR